MFTSIKQMTSALLLLIGTLLFLSSAAQAQRQQISVGKHIEILKGKLKLSNEQTKKITTILEDQREEMITVTNNNRGDRQALLTAVHEITKQTDKKIKEILTEEQVKAYDTIIKNRQAKAGKRMKSSKK